MISWGLRVSRVYYDMIRWFRKDRETSLFQNSVSFGTSSSKNRAKPVFSIKSKEAVPKTDLLEQPQTSFNFIEQDIMRKIVAEVAPSILWLSPNRFSGTLVFRSR
jgi:hypothetical protein